MMRPATRTNIRLCSQSTAEEDLPAKTLGQLDSCLLVAKCILLLVESNRAGHLHGDLVESGWDKLAHQERHAHQLELHEARANTWSTSPTLVWVRHLLDTVRSISLQLIVVYPC